MLTTLNNSHFNVLTTKIYVVEWCQAPKNTPPGFCGRALCSTMSQKHGDNWLVLYGGDD